jgi:hypothetical protein
VTRRMKGGTTGPEKQPLLGNDLVHKRKYQSHSWAMSQLETMEELQSQSHVTIDGQSISPSWCRAPSGAHDQIFIIG